MIAELVLPAKIGGLATTPRLAIKGGMKPVFRTLGVVLLTLGFATEARPQVLSPDLLHELHWRNIGPFRGGRTRAAAGVPDQPHVFYMAQVNGGVWKTDDAGQTWHPVFDAQPTQSCDDVASTEPSGSLNIPISRRGAPLYEALG